MTYRPGADLSALEAGAERGDFTIVGCLYAGDIESEVQQHFPITITHRMDALARTGLLGKFEGVDTRLLTPEFVQAFQWAEPVAMRMMDRMDTQRAFTYRQRRDLWHFLLCYWFHVIETEGVDAFYSRQTPHEVVDFVLFVVMKTLGKRVRFFAWTSISARWILVDDYRHPRVEVEPIEIASRPFSGNDIDQIIEPLRGSYGEAMPTYMDRVIDDIGHASGARTSVDQLQEYVRQTIVAVGAGASLVVRTARNSESTASSPVARVLSRVGDAWQVRQGSRRLVAAYAARATAVPAGLPYVYYLLGYQPENTNCPEGGLLGDQLLAVSLLAASLPDGWEVVVKEHPSQLMNNGRGVSDYGFLGRDTVFYEAIARIPGVRLAHVNSDHFEMLDSARVVSTLTGTVGWEAAVRGKPVFCLGEAWYLEAPNVFTVKTRVECEAAYAGVTNNQILTGPEHDKALTSYLLALSARTHYVAFDADDARHNGVDFNGDNECAKLEQVFRRQFSGVQSE